jgi:hypothetical protein
LIEGCEPPKALLVGVLQADVQRPGDPEIAPQPHSRGTDFPHDRLQWSPGFWGRAVIDDQQPAYLGRERQQILSAL